MGEKKPQRNIITDVILIILMAKKGAFIGRMVWEPLSGRI
jgi:hypothetical protein